MAYYFNQMRYNASVNYTQEIDWTEGTKETYNVLYNLKYEDTCLNLGGSTPVFDLNKTYYLRFFVKMKDYVQTGTIYIKSSDEESSIDDPSLYNQVIENDKVFIVPALPAGETEKYVEFNVVFKSIKARDQIVFVLARDEHSSDPAKPHQRFILDSSRTSLRTITNVMPSGVEGFKQIGIQGYPGLKVCIDGELIRVGQTGIYEVNNGYLISFLGFIYNYPEDNNKPFILDYQY